MEPVFAKVLHRCPKCGSESVKRSHRRGFVETGSSFVSQSVALSMREVRHEILGLYVIEKEESVH
jgi:hypothetical protein